MSGRLQDAIKAGYLISSSRNTALHNAWFEYCERTQHPYVLIHPNKKNSWVEIDLIGQEYDLHPIAALEISRLLEQHCAKNQDFLGCYSVGDLPATLIGAKVIADQAEPIARLMVALASNPRHQVKDYNEWWDRNRLRMKEET